MSDTRTPETLEPLLARLAELEAMAQRQQARVAEQDARIARQQARIARLEGMPPTSAATMTEKEPARQHEPPPAAATRHTSRRALLKLGGAAAAAGVAAVAAGASELTHPGTAHAHSETATFLQTASGSTNTAIEGDGTSGAIGLTGTSVGGVGVYGASTNFYGVWGSSGSNIAVLGTSTTGTGVHGKTDGGSGVPGVHGIATQGIGVLGESTQNTGVLGTGNSVGVEGNSASGTAVAGFSGTGDGVYGNSNTGVGGVFAGGRAALSLRPVALVPGVPTSVQHYGGDVYVDGQYVLWYCIAAGTPGTWIRVSGPPSGVPGGALCYLAAPIRIFDPRAGQPAPLPVTKAPLAGGSTITIQVTGTSVGGLAVPAGATGVFGNLTVTNAQGGGDLILWPHGAPQPLTSNINYESGHTVANSVNVGLSADGKLDLYVHVNGTDVIIDIAGYVL